MHSFGVVLILIVVFALAFDYINGFHDTANAIATVVSTRVLTPLQAILMAATLNFAGALIATHVAQTIASDIVSQPQTTETVVLAAIVGGIVWNLVTWRFGIPSSSSHALIGGLVGAAMAHGGFAIVHWGLAGLTGKVLLPLVASPIIGFILGYILMKAITRYVANANPDKTGTRILNAFAQIGGLLAAIAAGVVLTIVFRKTLGPLREPELQAVLTACGAVAAGYASFHYLAQSRIGDAFRFLQRFSSAAMALSHGQNDAQKSMGVITLALLSRGFLTKPDVPIWVIVACATVMAFGTAAGGWRIIRTMGHKIIRLEPVSGFAAECSGATVIFAAGYLGMPVSTTHVIAGSIFGVGASKRRSAVRWQVAQTMVIAWVITIPAAATVGALAYGALTLAHI